MKIRLNYVAKDRGMLILEFEPQFRTMFFVNGNKSIKRVPFPYFIVVLSYEIVNGKICYFGLKGGGLRIYFNNKPLKSFEDAVWFSLTESYGIVCTDHSFDNYVCDNIFELKNTILNLWFGTYVSYQGEQIRTWSGSTLDNVIDTAFRAGSLRENFELDSKQFKIGCKYNPSCKYNQKGFSLFPVDAVLIDEEWSNFVKNSNLRPEGKIIAALEEFVEEFLKQNEPK